MRERAEAYVGNYAGIVVSQHSIYWIASGPYPRDEEKRSRYEERCRYDGEFIGDVYSPVGERHRCAVFHVGGGFPRPTCSEVGRRECEER